MANINLKVSGQIVQVSLASSSNTEKYSDFTGNEVTARDDEQVQADEAKQFACKRRTEEDELAPSKVKRVERNTKDGDRALEIEKPEINKVDEAAASTVTERDGDGAGPSTEADDDTLKELRKQNEAYQVHSKPTSEKIRFDIYNAEFKMSAEDCLDQCKKLIKYRQSTDVYNYHFVVCEGLADKLRTNTGLTADLPKHDIYKCIKMLAPYTTFQTLAIMLYRFRYAVALAIAGDIDKAVSESEKGNETLQLCLKDKSLATAGLSPLYGYINVRLGEFSAKAAVAKTEERELKENIIEMISEGMEKAEFIENEKNKNMYQRMYLMKRTVCYLNIGVHSEDIFDPEELHITTDDRKKASHCLQEVKVKHWKQTEIRRRMLYRRAKAKLHWIDGERSEAVKSLKKAIAMAEGFKREEIAYKRILQKWEECMKMQSSTNTVV